MRRIRVFLIGLLYLIIAFLQGIPSGAAISEAQAIGPTAEGADMDDTPPLIYLVRGSFDPLRESLPVPGSLSMSMDENSGPGEYILQFTGPVLPEWLEAVEAAGVRLGDYIPEYAFLAHLDPDLAQRVSALPFVRWIGPYQPAYKLALDADYSDRRSYKLDLFPWADRAVVMAALDSMGVEWRDFETGLSAVLAGDQLDRVAQLPGITWIEPYFLKQTYNNTSGGTIMGGVSAWKSGYTGSGVTIAVADTGLDTGTGDSIHQDFTGRVSHISSWPVQNINWGSGCVPVNIGANDGAADTSSGHGTHVSGSLAGSGAASSGLYKGLAYEATITFQAVEQYTTWAPGCFLSPGSYLTGIPDDIRPLLNEAYGWGARIHNDSWGGGPDGVYTQEAYYFDHFIHHHPDMVVVVAAGNSGRDSDRNGYVDENSISSPATAKNLITIGAVDNESPAGGYAGLSWYLFLSERYPTNPTRNDLVSNSREELAAFSSRGPMSDGRIKPDLVAPGTNIISTRSSQTSSTSWGVYDTQYMYSGGTSMASPLAAGAAALVREYYIEREGHNNPSAALIKGTLINSAVDISGYGNPNQEAGKPIPNNHEGWGRIDVAAATSPGERIFIDNTLGLNHGVTAAYEYNLGTGQPFKVTLVWSDYPGSPSAAKALVNNLNLRVTAPDGMTTYWGNRFSGGWSTTGGLADNVNNVENVYIQSPQTGIWKVEVLGFNIPFGPQPFALVVNGNILGQNTRIYLPAVVSN